MNLLLLVFFITLQKGKIEASTTLVATVQELENKVSDIFEDNDILTGIFPVLKKSCVKDALDPFLPQCLLNGFETIGDNIKMETAVKLSLCQFEASKLEQVPFECLYTRNTENMMACMLELESSNQWWTTYNGYYQNLPMLCVSQDPIFQKEQMIKTFLNITTMVSNMNKNWDGKLDDYMENVDSKVTQQLNNLEQKYNDTLIKVEDANINLDEVFQDIKNTLNQNENLFSNNLKRKEDNIFREIETLQNIIENITDKIQEDNIIKKIEEGNSDSLALWDDLNMKLNQNIEERIRDQVEIDSYVSNIKSNVKLLNKEIDSISTVNIETNIKDQLGHINDQFISEWLSLTQILNKDIQFWNEIISDNFEMISKKLETTIEKVDYMENKINTLFKIFTSLNQLFGNCSRLVWNFLMNFKELLTFLFLFPVIKILGYTFKTLKIKRFIYWVLVILGVVLGNHMGFKITMGIFSTKRTLN